MIVLLLAAGASVYQLLALVACLAHLRRKDPAPASLPPISILKPVRGRDPHFEAAIESHARIDYPEFELLFSVPGADDPALPAIQALKTKYPHRPIEVIETRTVYPNGKVGALVDLAARARYPVIVVNDSDIEVPGDYLRVLAGHLEKPEVGLVTSLYRAHGDVFASKLEALGIATDFAPSTLVAPLVGVNEFGLGSTLCFRREILERIGGFAAIGEYLADDYQLGKRISGLGLKVVLTRMVVETKLSGETLGDVWAHQVRWARTIRVSRGGGYAGLFLTNATLFALLLLLAGHPVASLALLLLRMTTALVAAGPVLGDGQALRWLPLVPLRDLFGLAVWAAGLFGSTVRWRDKTHRLLPDGRIV